MATTDTHIHGDKPCQQDIAGHQRTSEAPVKSQRALTRNRTIETTVNTSHPNQSAVLTYTNIKVVGVSGSTVQRVEKDRLATINELNKIPLILRL